MRILIAGGGTGGHLFPAIALAEAFREKDEGNEIRIISTMRALDSQVLAGRGFSFQALEAEGIKGKGIAGKMRAILKLPQAMGKCWKMMKAYEPHLVFGVGGYVSGPVVLTSWLKQIPCAIQEQNSIPGLTNRLLGKVVDQVFCAFEKSETFFPKGKCRVTGNPIRKDLQKIAEERPASLRPFTLLILGGSQGAHRINQEVVHSLEDLIPWKSDLFFIHQTGQNDETWVAQAYEEKGFHYQVMAFITDMAWAYSQAQMIIARAGAMTLTEITALGKPSLLIPFPYAANNHQEHNALSLVQAGAAEMVLEKDIKPGFLSERIQDWLENPDRLIQMAQKAKKLGNWQAAEEIVESCYQLIQKKGFKDSRIRGFK